MEGTIELEVVDRPEYLNLSKGKNKDYYTKIIKTLDVIAATKSIKLPPKELQGKDTKTKLIALRGAINRALKALKKDYTACIEFDETDNVIHIWRRIKFK